MTLTTSKLESLAASLFEDARSDDAYLVLECLSMLTNLRDAAQTASNYIHHVGANQTEQGLPHPQALLLSRLDDNLKALNNLET